VLRWWPAPWPASPIPAVGPRRCRAAPPTDDVIDNPGKRQAPAYGFWRKLHQNVRLRPLWSPSRVDCPMHPVISTAALRPACQRRVAV
jgi:hypothetical protein